jgi:hypothetical protein
VSLSIEQLSRLIKEHPEGLKLEEIQEVLSKENIDADSSTLHQMLVKLEQGKAITSEIRPRKIGGWDRCWLPRSI